MIIGVIILLYNGFRLLQSPDETVIGFEALPDLLGRDGIVVVSGYHLKGLAEYIEELGLKCAVFDNNRNMLFGFDSNRGFEYEWFYANRTPVLKHLYLALSLKCNLDCRYCPHHGENPPLPPSPAEKINMSWDMMRELTSQAKGISTLTALTLTGRGKVFMNPDWYDMVCYICARATPEIPRQVLDLLHNFKIFGEGLAKRRGLMSEQAFFRRKNARSESLCRATPKRKLQLCKRSIKRFLVDTRMEEQ